MKKLSLIVFCLSWFSLVWGARGKSIIKPCMTYYPALAKDQKTPAGIKSALLAYNCQWRDYSALNRINKKAKLKKIKCKKYKTMPAFYCNLSFDNGQTLHIHQAQYPNLKPCVYYYQQFAKRHDVAPDIRATLLFLRCVRKEDIDLSYVNPKAKLLYVHRCHESFSKLTCSLHFEDGSTATVSGHTFPGLQ